MATDDAGSDYFSDLGLDIVLKVDSQGKLWRVAGSGRREDSPDVGRPEEAGWRGPGAVAVDNDGGVYIGDCEGDRILEVWPGGPIETIAGCGTCGRMLEGSRALDFYVYPEGGLAFSAAGELHFAEQMSGLVRKIDSGGRVWTVVGIATGTWINQRGFTGDGGPATSALLKAPMGIAFDSAGNLFIADMRNDRIRKVTFGGTISTIAGGGTEVPRTGLEATDIQLGSPYGIAVDHQGNVILTEAWGALLEVSASGIMRIVAGQAGNPGLSGDGGPAVDARLGAELRGVAADAGGNTYVADVGNRRIRKIDQAGTISTIAGDGGSNFAGDGGPATLALLDWPADVASDPNGSLLIADSINHRVRKVDATGTSTTIAGTGVAGLSGDGGPATAAPLNRPVGIAADRAGRFRARQGNHLRGGGRRMTSSDSLRGDLPPADSA